MTMHRRFAALCALLAAAGATAPPVRPQAAEPVAGSFGERLEITAVAVPVRARASQGKAPSLSPADLEVLEDGQAVTVLALERIGGPGSRPAPAASDPAGPRSAAAPARAWRIVVYIDLQLAGITSVRQAAWDLGGQAEKLAALGEVEVVLVDDAPKRVFGPSRDADAIKKALRKGAADNFGQRRLVRLRQEFFSRANGALGLANRRGTAGGSGSEVNLVRAFGYEEARLLETRRQMLESYFAERSIPDWPQAAFLVSGGYDLEPGDFYLPIAEGSGGDSADFQRLRGDFQRFSQSSANEGVARQLAVLGWTVFPVLPYDQDLSFSASAANDGSSRWRAMAGGPGAGAAPLTLIRHPEEPWRAMAETTGGELIADLRKLDDAVEGLESRLLLTYQVGRRRDGSLHRLEVRSRRAGVEVSAPAWISSGTPEAVAAARAKALLAGEAGAGDLPVSATVTAAAADDKGQSAGQVEARVEFAPLGAVRQTLGATTLRFTIAVPRPDGTVMVIHERAENADLRERGGWIFDARLVAPKGTDRIGVVVEELGTGAWGGVVARWGS